MIKETKNIANIFYPQEKLTQSGYLVGYNFEGFMFVIASVISPDQITSLSDLSQIIQEQKFQAFNRYCASEPKILGVIENGLNNEQQLSKKMETAEFKKNQHIWITLTTKQQDKTTNIELQELTINEQKYKVIPHFIVYPKQREGEFLSLSKMNYSDIINKSSSWDKNSPYIDQNELFNNNDLTENDIIIRQINCSKILTRLLQKRLLNKDIANEPFVFERDFYGDMKFGFSFGFLIRICIFIYLILYIPYRLSIWILGVLSPLGKLNTVIQLRKKKENFQKCKQYIKILNEKVTNDLYFDNHFYKLSVFSKLTSIITQMIIDVSLGILMLVIINNYTQEILETLHFFGQVLHIDVLERQVKYLMNLPADFKPNPHLDNFLGNLMLDIIQIWNYVTTELTYMEFILLRYLALFGTMGISFQFALAHDYLFFCSFHIFILYSVLSQIYKQILRMVVTLFRLFSGKKYNVLRKRVDQNNFQIQELYLGVLIITLIIFLTPTIAMYYYFCYIFIIVNMLINQVILLNLQNMATNFPFFLLVKAITKPYSLPNSFTLQIGEGNEQYYKIKANQCDKGQVFQHLIGEAKVIFQEVSPPKVIKMIAIGDNLFYVMRNLLIISTKGNVQLQKPQPNNNEENAVQQEIGYIRKLMEIVRF